MLKFKVFHGVETTCLVVKVLMYENVSKITLNLFVTNRTYLCVECVTIILVSDTIEKDNLEGQNQDFEVSSGGRKVIGSGGRIIGRVLTITTMEGGR